MAQEACADEGIDAEVLLAFACFGIDGCIGFGLVQLGIEAGLSVLERGKFFGSGRCSIMGGGISLRFGREEDTVCFGAGLLETELMLQFFALCRILLPVAGVHDLVRLRVGHSFDAAFGITVGFAAIDCAAFSKCAVEFTNGVFEYTFHRFILCFCYTCVSAIRHCTIYWTTYSISLLQCVKCSRLQCMYVMLVNSVCYRICQ